MKRLVNLATVLAIVSALFLPQEAPAASVYANWLKVKQIRYHANADAYLVSFDGSAGTDETDSSGNPCSSYDFTVIKANNDGAPTTSEQVDRMIQALEIARASGLRVRVWVSSCTGAISTVTYPKAYAVWTVE